MSNESHFQNRTNLLLSKSIHLIVGGEGHFGGPEGILSYHSTHRERLVKGI
jgi:hypothetical protein